MAGEATAAYIATRKGLFRLARGSTGWRVAGASFVGDTVTMVLPDPRDGTLYAAVGHGHFGVKMHQSDDRGESWKECSAPTYPPKPEGLEDKDPARGTPIPWSTQQVWSMETGGSAQPGVIWCGTIPGGLFRSSDGGQSWQLCESLWRHPSRSEWFGGGYDYPGIHSICVDPTRADRVLVGVSCGGVWETEDAGANWKCKTEGMWAAYMPPERKNDPAVQDPHRMTMCRARPECMWVQHHNGVFRTVDGARTWTEIEKVPPSNFGFAVAVHPGDAETAWLAPAQSDERRVPLDGRVVVSRTRDGGKSFDACARGLPAQHAYDLVYRHALDVDGSGTRLIMGSTTGALWLSEDQGDSWSEVSAHLPPIYVTRFATG